jgi:hypothetical protein
VEGAAPYDADGVIDRAWEQLAMTHLKEGTTWHTSTWTW